MGKFIQQATEPFDSPNPPSVDSPQDLDDNVTSGVPIHELADKRPAAKYYCHKCDDTYDNQLNAKEDAEKNGHTHCWEMKYNLPRSWDRIES